MIDLEELFQPEVCAWFKGEFPAPTAVQMASWPHIAAGEHLLITAPTGSGKTLTAFLHALNRFAAGSLEPGATRVLYVSPLKALNNDIRRNLLNPLERLEARGAIPRIRALTRSGDTAQGDRERMLRHPPEILITTPESLFLLLTNRRGRERLATVDTVIVDEVHSIVDNRRGVHLATSLERLADIAGEYQRIALSATVRPLEDVAAFIGGCDAAGSARRVRIVDAGGDKQIEFRVRFPEHARAAAENGQPIWDPLSDAFRGHIDANVSTLFFTNSRSLAEKVTFKLNEDATGPLAYAHHGSLARDIRTTVESRLKAGELKAIVATSSLEMGIDIGHLDEVVLVQSPGSVASTLQRIGRAGHGVGETSVGTLYPTHAVDFIEAAVLADAISERDIEPLTIMQNALDVLAQIIVSLAAHEPWHVEEAYGLITRAYPYRHLSREHFELVLEMLAGRYAGSRVRELKARVHYDRIAGTVHTHKGALLALYNSGGTIPDRGYYQLRHADSGATLGELDEEFVWEAKIGQLFSFGTQNWQIQRITHNDVLVKPGKSDVLAPPFWRSEVINRSFHLSARIATFLENAEASLAERTGVLEASLEEEHGFDATAAGELVDFLKRQREATGTPLPHRHHLLLEHVQTGPGGYRGPNDISHLVIHSFWGGRVNRPWALAIEAAWRERFGTDPEIHADNNAISIQLSGTVDSGTVLGLVTPGNLPTLLRESLEGSGFFGARFRECAGRSLLLTRRRFDQRLPLWMSRLQAKKLMGNVAEYTDFPVLLEAWRTCLDDEFDLPALTGLLEELEDGVIGYSAVTTQTPSPMAASLTFDAVSRYMYADDTPEQRLKTGLADDLIAGALADARLRPRVTQEIVRVFVSKRQRLKEDYRPETQEAWEDYLKERVLVPEQEAHEALALAARGCRITAGERSWLAHPESLHALTRSALVGREAVSGAEVVALKDDRSAEQLCLELLSFYGPLTQREIEALLPGAPDGLLEDEALLHGTLLEEDDEDRYCDRDNFEALLRMQRAARRPLLEPRDFDALTPFLAGWQEFGRRADADSVHDVLARLAGFAAPVRCWLEDLLTARLSGASDHLLDETFAALGMIWYGTGREAVSLGYAEDLPLLVEEPAPSSLGPLFLDPGARYDFLALADRQRDGIETCSDALWQAIWQGEIYGDNLATLRQGARGRFRLSDGGSRATARPGRRRARARLASGWPGSFALRAATTEEEPDPLTELEDNKERARLLLDRYGLLCRELANREGGLLRWARIARALFAMELAGEVVAGYFFSGLSGPQFMTPAALHRFQQRKDPPSFWLSALDPASSCGLGVGNDGLPARREGNYLAYQDGALALVVEGGGKRLRFLVEPDHPALAELCAPLVVLARRRRRISVETVNDEPVTASPYLPALEQVLLPTRDHRGMSFEPR